MCAVPQSTLGYEKLFNWAFAITDEDAFVKAVLEGQPEPPFYFADMKRVNKEGPNILEPIRLSEPLTAQQLEQRLTEGLRVIDLRGAAEYAAHHIPGTMSIPLDNTFLSRAGWFISSGQPFALISDEQGVLQAARLLRLIGLEKLVGFWPLETIDEWKATGRQLKQFPALDVARLQERLKRHEVTLIDVRGASEYEAGSVAGSRNIPLGYLERQIREIPKGRPVVVICHSGSRSAVAASVLETHRYTNVINLQGGFEAWEQAGYPVVRGGQGVQEAAGVASL
jgi:hydroxyacylglutathione hydrolase